MVAHLPRHSFAFKNFARSGPCADRTRGPLPVRLTVRFRTTAETISFHCTRKPLPLTCADNIYAVTDLENIYLDRLSRLDLRVRGAKFPQITKWR